MICPSCGKAIPDELVKHEGARLMVASRADRKKPKDKHEQTRAKIRQLMEELQQLKDDYERPEEPSRRTNSKTKA